LVFGELSGLGSSARALIIAGSGIMIAGVLAIGFAEAQGDERQFWRKAVRRECDRYGLDPERVASILQGNDPLADGKAKRHWWEALVALAAIGLFVELGAGATRPEIAFHAGWMAALGGASLALLAVCGRLLWKRTRFS